MKIRPANINDAKSIHGLITYYGGFDRMLFRSLADIYENLQTFLIAEEDGRFAGCCALQVIWSDLAEIKSLAVSQEFAGKGIGRALVTGAVDKARELGISKVFALTLEAGFFQKLGFQVVNNDLLPMKVWRDCAKCSKQENCDEIAVILELEGKK